MQSTGGLGRSDRVDLLRAYSLAFIRLGRPDDQACRRLGREVRPPVPLEGRGIRLPAGRGLAYLQAPTAAPKIMAALREANTQEEKVQYALILRVLKAGWTPPLREEYFRWSRRRRGAGTGNTSPAAQENQDPGDRELERRRTGGVEPDP